MNGESQAESTESRSLAERGRLLLALYEGAIGFLEQAAGAHEKRDFERFAHFIMRAQNVIDELASTLDYEQGRDLATMLSRLYEFMIFQLGEACRSRNLEVVREETNRLREIYDSYRQVITGGCAQGTGSPKGTVSSSDASVEGCNTRAGNVREQQ